MEVADIMEDAKGKPLVLNNKQGFVDSELYVQLEDWLGQKFNQYWATYFGSLEVEDRTNLDKPFDNSALCDKCNKWRKLRSDINRTKLPVKWFCYMDPFFGNCEIPEVKYGEEVITWSGDTSGRSDGDSDYEEDCPTSTRLKK